MCVVWSFMQNVENNSKETQKMQCSSFNWTHVSISLNTYHYSLKLRHPVFGKLLLQKEVEREVAKFEAATQENLAMIVNSGMLVPCGTPFTIDTDLAKTQASLDAQCELGFQLSGYSMPVDELQQLNSLDKSLSPSKSPWDSAFDSGSDLSTEDSSDDECGNAVNVTTYFTFFLLFSKCKINTTI